MAAYLFYLDFEPQSAARSFSLIARITQKEKSVKSALSARDYGKCVLADYADYAERKKSVKSALSARVYASVSR